MDVNKSEVTQRPLSPHLTIYSPQISSTMSALHRITGVAIFCSLSLLCWWLILFIFSKFNVQYVYFISNNIMIKSAIYLTALGFCYHMLNGIRHLIWDSGRALTLKHMRISGWVVISSTVIMTLYIWGFVL